VLLHAKTEVLCTTRDRKCLFEVLKGKPVLDDLVCKPSLNLDGGDYNIGSVLSPQKECLMKVVKLRNEEGSILLLLRDSVV
jgi:hypothetical protein